MTSADAPSLLPESDPLQSAPALGRSVGHGISWMLAVTVAAKGMAFVAQVALGWLLSAGDFGVYALAIAASGVVSVFRDGGVKELLIQRGAREYASLSGSLFWLAVAINLITGAALAGLAPLVANIYDDPRLVGMLLVIAASLPLGTPAAVLQSKLRMDMKFAQVGRIAIGSAVVRNVLTIAFAAAGMGPMSFVLPLLAIAVYEGVASYVQTRDPVWKRPARAHLWPGYLSATGWLMVGMLANLLVDWGNYLAVGLFVSLAVVGIYSFAFTLIVQLAMLLSSNVQLVLTPALARLNDEPGRRRDAIARSLKALMLVAAPACLGFAAIAEPMEYVLWRGKWADAIPAVQAFGVFYPMRITFGLTLAVLQAQGRFKRWAILTGVEGVVMIAAAALAAYVWGTPGSIALWVGGSMAISRFAITWHTLAICGVARVHRAGAMLLPWGVALLAWTPLYFADKALVRSEKWSELVAWLSRSGLGERWGPVAAQAMRLAGLGAAFAFGFAILAMLLIPRHVREAVQASPVRVPGLIRRRLGL